MNLKKLKNEFLEYLEIEKIDQKKLSKIIIIT
jgi:hypothetical protein